MFKKTKWPALTKRLATPAVGKEDEDKTEVLHHLFQQSSLSRLSSMVFV